VYIYILYNYVTLVVLLPYFLHFVEPAKVVSLDLLLFKQYYLM
jgi:hypothetical protein